MSTRPDQIPIQVDRVPEEYDAAAVQRVLESAVRRVTDRTPTPQVQKLDKTAEDNNPLPWVL